MSYGLQLWRQVDDVTIPLKGLWAAFENGRIVAGVAPLDRDQVVEVLRSVFPQVQDGGHQLEWEGDGSYFQIDFTYQSTHEVSSLLFSCGFSLPSATLARVFDFAWKMELSVYDGQVGKIFVPIGTATKPATAWERFRRKKWHEQTA